MKAFKEYQMIHPGEVSQWKTLRNLLRACGTCEDSTIQMLGVLKSV